MRQWIGSATSNLTWRRGKGHSQLPRFLVDDLTRLRRAILLSAVLLPSRSQGCVNQTSPNLVRTEGDRSYTRNVFQRSDTLLHFQTRATQI